MFVTSTGNYYETCCVHLSGSEFQTAEAVPWLLPLGIAKQGGRFTSLYLALAKFLLHLLTAARYGIFRDEMYYVACSKHLAWGYVDHPPMSVLINSILLP
jgi:hypothetical protein